MAVAAPPKALPFVRDYTDAEDMVRHRLSYRSPAITDEHKTIVVKEGLTVLEGLSIDLSNAIYIMDQKTLDRLTKPDQHLFEDALANLIPDVS